MEITVERKNMKTVRLRVKPDGSVFLSAPKGVSTASLEAFVRENIDWLRSKLEQLPAQKEPCEFLDGDSLPVFGEPCPLRLEVGGDSRFSLLFSEGEILLRAPGGSSPQQREAAIDELLYRRLLLDFIPECARLWEPVLRVHARQWSTRRMKTRWGSCNTSNAHIWLSVRLASRPQECIEYVIVHELCHLLEPSHNARFHSLMDGFMPDWRERKKRLNNKQ